MDLNNRKSKRIGILSMLLSRLASGLTKPSLKLLIMLGGPNGFFRVNAISFCNVLFVGNLCVSIIPFFLSFKNIVPELKKLTLKYWAILFLSIVLNALVPSLTYFAILKGNLINVVIIGNFRGITLAFFGYLFLKRRYSRSDIFGYLLIVLGLAVLLFSQGLKNFGMGEFLMFLSTFFIGLLNTIDVKCLDVFSELTYLFIVNFCSAIVFFIIVMMFYGPQHFADAFEGRLWLLMLLYAGVAVLGKQAFWLFGIKRVSAVIATNMKLITPIFALVFTYLLLKEVPSLQQVISLGIIIVGLFLAKLMGLAPFREDRMKITDRSGTA